MHRYNLFHVTELNFDTGPQCWTLSTTKLITKWLRGKTTIILQAHHLEAIVFKLIFPIHPIWKVIYTAAQLNGIFYLTAIFRSLLWSNHDYTMQHHTSHVLVQIIVSPNIIAKPGVSEWAIITIFRQVRDNGTTIQRPQEHQQRITPEKTSLRATFIGRTIGNLSLHTITHWLLWVGYSSRMSARCPRLKIQHHWCRWQLLRQHRAWNLRRWRFRIFTDKSHFKLHCTDGRIWPCEGKIHTCITVCVQQALGNVGPSTIVWGGFNQVTVS